MSRITKTVLAVLIVSCLLSCNSDSKPSIKTAQEKIESDIKLQLQGSMAEMGLSSVKLKNAPKDSGNTWVGVATFDNGGGRIDQDITAFYNDKTQSIFYWFSDDMEYMSEIPLVAHTEESVKKQINTPVTQPAQSSSNTQSVDTLGKVQQKGSTFTTFDSKGKEITHFSSPNMELVGWGIDFFVIRSGTTFKTYDPRCKQITSISIGAASTASVQNDTFTVKVGSSSQKYDKNGKRK
jgi:hypothetical protein